MLIPLVVGCADLSYPEPESAALPPSAPIEDDRAAGAIAATTAGLEAATRPEAALGWSELTRMARELQQRGEFDEAIVRLDQAQNQVVVFPATDARRRAVFGMRAGLAHRIADAGETEQSDLLADQLIAEATDDPGLAGPALTDLILSVLQRRDQAAAEERPDSSETDPTLDESDPHRLELLKLAFLGTREGPSGRDRLNLAYWLATEARRQGDYTTARDALDQALLDARRIDPNNMPQLAALRINRARIALAQGETETARGDSIRAISLLEKDSPEAADIIIARGLLGRALAQDGHFDEAQAEIDKGLAALLDDKSDTDQYARREILGAQADVSAARGEREIAIEQFRAALDIPAIDFAGDPDLVHEIAAALAAVERIGSAEASPESGSSELPDATSNEMPLESTATPTPEPH